MSGYFDFSKKHKAMNEPTPRALAGGSQESDKSVQLRQVPTHEVYVEATSRIIMYSNPHSPGADRFRLLRVCLQELWSAGKLKSLLITSPLPRDGKSTIAMNLATALAEAGKRRVLVIEADLYRPSIVEQLSLDAGPGLAECLETGANPLLLLQRLDPLNWYLLPAGKASGNPTELLQTGTLTEVMQQLSPHFDWVLIDSPPTRPLSDALILARQADATLLVAREGSTPDEAIEKAIALLGRQRVLGIVLNAVKGLDKLYSGYYVYADNKDVTAITPSIEDDQTLPRVIPAPDSGSNSRE